MLAAYVFGVEVAARLGAVAKGAFHQVGFHPTGLIGAFACALAAGRLMGLSREAAGDGARTDLSAGRAASNSWKTEPGTSVFIRAGRRSRGITAAALARQGFVGAKRAYEGRFGLYTSHLQNHFDPANLALANAGLGENWELLQVAVKPYPRVISSTPASTRPMTLSGAKLDAGEIEQRARAGPCGSGQDRLRAGG